MRLTPSDPDISTLVARIRDGEINLQPDFQRGEVWSVHKQRLLVDSILRDWHIPPVHIVVDEDTQDQEVLDGQQRLASIRDFANGTLSVDGFTDPPDKEIEALDGMTYHELPENFRRRFDNFSIRIFRLTEYRPGEPGELFFRLNQPTTLTPAEQRNAFFGPVRKQIKGLVGRLEEYDIDRSYLGFSNSRLSYDDVLARVAYSFHIGTLRERVTAKALRREYRSEEPFSNETIGKVDTALEVFGSLKPFLTAPVRFNKTTLYSWLCFLGVFCEYEDLEVNPESLGEYVYDVETSRSHVKGSDRSKLRESQWQEDVRLESLIGLLTIFNDRASSRVADAQSVLLRDLILWLLFYGHQERVLPVDGNLVDRLSIADELLNEINKSILSDEMELVLTQAVDHFDWGAKI